MSEVKNFKYLIGMIDTDQKQMALVEYESRSNRLLQAQLMSIQFPTSDLFKSFLSEFDSSEKVIFKYKTLTKRLPFSTFDGLFLYSELANEWYILDQNTHHTLMCAEKTGGFNLVNYRHSSGVYHEQETEDLHRRI